MYMEDIDLVRRIGKIKHSVYLPNVHIVHGFQKGSYKSFKLFLIHILSAIRYFNKWGWFFDYCREKNNPFPFLIKFKK